MAKVKTDQEKAQQRLARKAAAQERRERQEREIRARRAEQLRTAESELAKLEEAVAAARERKSRHEALSNHLVGFYDEVDTTNGVPWPTLNRTFRADVRRGADETDPRYERIVRLCRDYEYGNPALNFAGMFENDSERFAGLASGSMGDLLLMPPYIRRWYTGLFLGTRGAVDEKIRP